MDQSAPKDIRIGDAEREHALRALGEHFSAGRLDVDEYGERTAQASTARTRSELVALFADLPDPRPRFGEPVSARPADPPITPPIAGPAAVAARRWVAMVVMTIAWIGAALLVFEVKAWQLFLVPILLSVVYSKIWGPGPNPSDRRRRRRDRWR